MLRMKKSKFGKFLIVVILFLLFNLTLISSQITRNVNQTLGVKYCCEKTTYGAWCQNAPEEECDPNYRKTPTNCEATSYCKLGCCYDSNEGLCMENTPQRLCEDRGGTWADEKQCDIPQCQLGCCIIGTQAAYVTLTRCKKLSSFYGLETDFRRNVENELECIMLAGSSDVGACVFEIDYIKTCKFTTRQECNAMKGKTTIGNKSEGGHITGNVTFYKDLLCSAEELGTNCGPTQETTCVEGKDEVYFVDSCGNIANIYDASKINDKSYWRKVVRKEDSCGFGKSNVNSRSCGNCDYLSGSICKNYKAAKATKPLYGDNICADLNCKDTSAGPKKHGESWCSTDNPQDSVGSRYFRHICIEGEEIVEPCADYRQEICIEDNINGFSQAACRVNRWQDCYKQDNKKDCENKAKRDCVWILKGKKEVETTTPEEGNVSKVKEIACVPEHPPGFKFWEEGESQGICSLANTYCEVTLEKRGIGALLEDIGLIKESPALTEKCKEHCVENCECLEDSWEREQLKKCEALGDCGAKVNWMGVKGFEKGYKIKKQED